MRLNSVLLGSHVLTFPPVVPAQRHPGRAALRRWDAEGQRSADLRVPAALGVPRDHPQQHPLWERAEREEVRERPESVRSEEGERTRSNENSRPDRR